MRVFFLVLVAIIFFQFVRTFFAVIYACVLVMFSSVVLLALFSVYEGSCFCWGVLCDGALACL